MPSTTSIGRHAEGTALAYLKGQGLVHIESNFRCRLGEIDLIMQDGNTICFIEVRFRRSRLHASGAESITRSKIRKLIRTATVYLQLHPANENTDYRFDVVSIDDEINWIAGAFTADDY